MERFSMFDLGSNSQISDPSTIQQPGTPGQPQEVDMQKRMLLAQLLGGMNQQQPMQQPMQRPGMQAGGGLYRGIQNGMSNAIAMNRMMQMQQPRPQPIPGALPGTAGAGDIPAIPMA
jgi:hypothetical protein